MLDAEVVPTELMTVNKHGRILCYPNVQTDEFMRRLTELEDLGVQRLEFSGKAKINSTLVLGKGCVGIVIVAHSQFGRTALKIRRIDADRSAMKHEKEMLELANKISIGPTLFATTENFLLMELIEGELLCDWVKLERGQGELQSILMTLLEECFKLDALRLDHGQLSNASKHVIVDQRRYPKIVDFETASNLRRPANVTSMCQYLFFESEVSRRIARMHINLNRVDLIEKLRMYKTVPDRKNFNEILRVCGLPAGQ